MKTTKPDYYWLVLHSLLIFCIMIALSLQGCSGFTDSTAVEISGKAIDRIPQDVGRFSAWTTAVAAQEATKQKEAEVAKAEAEAEKIKVANTPAPDTPEKMAIASMLEMGKAMSKAIVAMAKGDKTQATIPMPKGVIAESIDSLGGAVEKVANTPTAVASAIGITAVKISLEAISGAGDKTTVNGAENQVTTTKTKTTTVNSTTGAESPLDVSSIQAAAEEEVAEVIE